MSRKSVSAEEDATKPNDHGQDDDYHRQRLRRLVDIVLKSFVKTFRPELFTSSKVGNEALICSQSRRLLSSGVTTPQPVSVQQDPQPPKPPRLTSEVKTKNRRSALRLLSGQTAAARLAAFN